MDRVSGVCAAGSWLVPEPSPSGRIELKCVFCDKLDPLKIYQP